MQIPTWAIWALLGTVSASTIPIGVGSYFGGANHANQQIERMKEKLIELQEFQEQKLTYENKLDHWAGRVLACGAETELEKMKQCIEGIKNSVQSIT